LTIESDRRLRESMGGSLRPSDPRRFLIEAMVGAMHADGVVDEREMETLERLLGKHDLFAALPQSVASMLIDLGSDAITFAGGAEQRVPVIARSLPGRTHRLAAYAMACEVCAADQEIADSELSYLAALRGALRISDREHDELIAAAKQNHAMLLLERKAQRIRDLVPLIVDCFALRRLAAGPLDQDSCNRIRAVLGSIPDLDVLPSAIDQEVERVFRMASRWSPVEVEMQHLALDMPDPADRYWLVVYLLVGELARGCTSWREVEFLSTAQRVFQLDGAEMDAAEANARLFEAAQ
jgi:uncharacterized tellurite resistance protein B-like protein